ncbi:MAG: response regulator [Elusimicrobia bacterium]|nr:response regulator [Elusimicrobiota bacterium]
MERPDRIGVLVVEDDEDDLKLIQLSLRQEALRVDGAGSCAAARRLLSANSYEVLLVDLQLPDGDGIDLLTLAREKDPDTVAIVLTGHSSTESVIAALHHGAYEYLIKPCPPKLIAAAVRRAAERHRLARALAERSAQLEAVNTDLQGRIRFMENLAHELKNPLSVVQGYTSFLLHRPISDWEPVELERAMQAIQRNSEFMHAMLEELMEATSVHKGKMPLRPEPLDACEEVKHAVDAFRLQAEQKGIRLESECMAGSGVVFEADRHRVRQVLQNLIVNALKFTLSQGRVGVSAKADGDGVQFTVSDTGVGIPKENLERIFDRFFQTDAGQRQKGLGLGLEIAKGIVSMHGGRIWAESAVGQGSSFHVTFPVRTAIATPVGKP